MMSFWAQMRVIAFRDFKAVAGTPVFLLFLLAPLLMLAMGILGGSGAQSAMERSTKTARLAVLTEPTTRPYLQAADDQLRPLMPRDIGMPKLVLIPGHGAADAKVAQALLNAPGTRYEAVMYGPLIQPQILSTNRRSATYLAALADHAVRSQKTGLAATQRVSSPAVTITANGGGTASARLAAGQGAMFVLFLLALLLSAQTVGTFVEEKSNKVIEILAAAAPLEAIFMGKLLGMYGVAMLFIGFWGGISAIAINVIVNLPGFPATQLDLAIGLPSFLILGWIYFTLSFFLLGAVFLGIGAQAPSAREVQMLSLPITFFQVGMFALASSAASQPDSQLALFAQIFPFSSPFAMVALGATQAAIWPHSLAILWQLLWVAITIRLGAALFRRGVLKSGPRLFSRLFGKAS